jgi:hypothetical protein
MDTLPLSEDYTPVGVESDPPQREPKKPNKTQKRVVIFLIVIAVCGAISLIGNKTGITKKFAPNVPVAESTEITPMAVEPTGAATTETEGEFQPSPDLEITRDELLEKSLNEVGFQVNNLSEAVAETFLLQARSAIEKQPISIELFLIKKVNFLANKLDKATLEGEFNGSPKERQKAADLLFEVWGNLLALKRHWETTAADQVQLKFTSVNVSVLAYEQQKRTEALQKQLELEAQKLAEKEAKNNVKAK